MLGTVTLLLFAFWFSFNRAKFLPSFAVCPASYLPSLLHPLSQRVHRNTSDSTNARVLWWSLAEAFVLLLITLWQVFYIRRFFEVKRIV